MSMYMIVDIILKGNSSDPLLLSGVHMQAVHREKHQLMAWVMEVCIHTSHNILLLHHKNHINSKKYSEIWSQFREIMAFVILKKIKEKKNHAFCFLKSH